MGQKTIFLQMVFFVISLLLSQAADIDATQQVRSSDCPRDQTERVLSECIGGNVTSRRGFRLLLE